MNIFPKTSDPRDLVGCRLVDKDGNRGDSWAELSLLWREGTLSASRGGTPSAVGPSEQTQWVQQMTKPETSLLGSITFNRPGMGLVSQPPLVSQASAEGFGADAGSLGWGKDSTCSQIRSHTHHYAPHQGASDEILGWDLHP